MVALPLTASADACIGTTLERVDQATFQMGELLVPDETPVRVEVVGTELWVQTADLLSVTIPEGASGFSACQSGNVVFSFPGVERESEQVNVVDLWAFDPTPRPLQGIF